MGLVSVPDSYTIPIYAQFSNYPSIFSMPCGGTAVVHPATETVDLFFTAVNENEPTVRNPGCYDYLSLKDICEIYLNCKGLDFESASTAVMLIRNGLDTGVLGRIGLKLQLFSGSNTKAAIGRVYTDDLRLVGSWSLSDGAPGAYYVMRQGDQYLFTVIGAKMVM